MPTSSIFTNVILRDREAIEKFADALEACDRDRRSRPSAQGRPNFRELTDLEEIRKLFAGGNTSQGRQ